MKKLKLNLEDLKVESFETELIKSNNGTVIGQNDDSHWATNCENTCLIPPCASGAITCGYEIGNQTCMHGCFPTGGVTACETCYPDCN